MANKISFSELDNVDSIITIQVGKLLNNPSKSCQFLVQNLKKRRRRGRPQFAGSSDAGFSGHHEKFEATLTVAEESVVSTSHLSRGLRTCPEKAFVTNNSPYKKISSSSGWADDCLTEILIMDGGDSVSSSNFTPKNSGDIFQSQTNLLDSKESVDNTEDKDDPTKDELKMEAFPLILVQAEVHDQKNSLCDLKSVEPDEKSLDCNMPDDICRKVEPDTSVAHASDNQHGAENAGSSHMFKVRFTSLLESLQIAEECGSSCENAGGPRAEPAEDKMHEHSPKVVEHQHGISRRFLQYEDAQGKIMANIGFQNSSGSADYRMSPASHGDSEVLESASLNKPHCPSSRFLDKMILPTLCPQNNRHYNRKVSEQLGIGLHLNSIINSMQMGSGAKLSTKSAERGTFDGHGKKSVSITSCHFHNNCSISLNEVKGISVSSTNSRHDIHASIATSSATLSPYSLKPLYEPVLLKPVALKSIPSNKRMSNSETSDSNKHFGQSSSKKKRKKTLDAGDSSCCKRCNCKKTKCLKLYCDCFAAGIYCAEPCACQGCFNRTEYEDTVLETRQQIEFRNPHAFAPKITQHISDLSTNFCVEDGQFFTPSSARHKRGCNCKKSKCLKKYCECYQANVGCSDGCRCEACENVCGRKREYVTTKDLVSKQESSETRDSSFDTRLETVTSKESSLHHELYDPHNLTPLTPSFHCFNHGKFGSKASFSSGEYIPSPDSGITCKAPYGMSPGQARSHDNHSKILTNPGIMDLAPFEQHLGYGNGLTVNQCSPRCDVASNAGHLTAPSNPQDWANTSRAQMFPGIRQISSASSLRWCNSPVTQSSNFEGTKLHEMVNLDDGLCTIMDDDTPEILKETPMPPNAVKVGSPNKKRVSPPHGRGAEFGSSSSAGLKTGCKFILPAVAFPLLTPCIHQNMNGSQNSSSK